MIGASLAGRYKVDEELGRGAMGVVYRGHDPLLDREVALKVLATGAMSSDARGRFEREARVVAKLDHPCILPVYDIGEHQGKLFLVMPVVEGDTLGELIEDGSLRLDDVLSIGVQAARALAYSHALGIIHRDIKPDNILVEPDGDELRARLTDFGLAVGKGEQRLTQSGAVVGTPAYLGPELVAGGVVDERSDVYSLGTVLYECLAGVVPFTGEVHAVLYRIAHVDPEPLRSFIPDIDGELEALLMRCIAKEPGRRPASAQALADELERIRARLMHEGRALCLLASVQVAPDARPAAQAAFPLVGRSRELAELERRLAAAAAGEGQVVLIGGEPGIGKTRLLEELEVLSRARRVRVLSASFAEQDHAFPYQGYCELVESYFRRASGAPRSTLCDLSDLEDDLLSLFPVLADLPAFPTGAASREPRDERDRTGVYETIARTLARIAGDEPLVLLLEDLHAAGVSLDALAYVARRLGSTRTLIAATYTTTEVGKGHALARLAAGFRGNRRFAHLLLERFGVEEHRAFVRNLAPGVPLDDGLSRRLYESTEGNPYFAQELYRALLGSDAVVQDASGSWMLAADTHAPFEAFPETIQKVIERRVDRLPEDRRALMALAAVMGRAFDFGDLVAALVAAEGELAGVDLDEAADELVAAGFWEAQRGRRDDRVRFTSNAMREVLYAAIPRRRRRAIHRSVAEVLEQRHAGRLERVRSQLLHHFAEGDVADKVFEHGLAVARAHLAAFGAADAIKAARTTLMFLEDEDAGGSAMAAEAHIVVARAEEVAGHVPEALREAEIATDTYQALGDIAAALAAACFAAETAWEARRVGDATRWIERGLGLAEGSGELDARLRLLHLGTTVANLRGDHAAARGYQEQAGELSSESPPPSIRALPGGTVTACVANALQAIEPSDIELVEEVEVLCNAFETLVTADASGRLEPLLCERWDADAEGRVFTFELREALLHDGRPLTAALAVLALSRSARRCHGRLPVALEVMRGAVAFAAGNAERIAGLSAEGERTLRVELDEPLPFYPSLLTDGRCAIACASHPGHGQPGHGVGPGDAAVVGTGPFMLAEAAPGRMVLEKNPRHWQRVPLVDRLEFVCGVAPGTIADAFREGRYHLARDLPPAHLEDILRERQPGVRYLEASRSNLFFILLNTTRVADPRVRQALCGVVPVEDLVWRHVGRLGRPAFGLIPAGMLGHDAGRRRSTLTVDAARELCDQAGAAPPRLEVAVHPLLSGQHGEVVRGVLDAWAELGVEVDLCTPDMDSFRKHMVGEASADVGFVRWIADYADPDSFTVGLFHSQTGRFRHFHADGALDAQLIAARHERDPDRRAALYRRVDGELVDAGVVLPLWSSTDYRLASPLLRQVELGSQPPYLRYDSLSLGASPGVVAPRPRQGVLTVSVSDKLGSLDPAAMQTAAQADVLASAYETLTKEVAGAAVVPWLARGWEVSDGGRSCRLVLRDEVRFHDGRALGARDVRYSFERMIGGLCPYRDLFADIVGADDLISGRSRELRGLRIHSPTELSFELERPLVFFPALLSHKSASIVAEGARFRGSSWRDGCVGTGPFRVIDFVPDELLDLEAFPQYWRPGFPRCERLTARLDMSPKDAAEELRAGRLAITSNLDPDDLEDLRRDPALGAGYVEAPRLCTYLLCFNIHHGPFADPELRKRVARGLDPTSLVRAHAGRTAIVARSLLPPGLLGHDPEPRVPSSTPSAQSLPPRPPRPPSPRTSAPAVEVRCLVHPIFGSTYATLMARFTDMMRELGVTLHVEWGYQRGADCDAYLGRWIGDYPDADTFMCAALHSRLGRFGHLCGRQDIDDLAMQGRATADRDHRYQLYRQVEAIVAEHALLLPLFHENIYCLHSPRVRGFADGALETTTGGVQYDRLWVE